MHTFIGILWFEEKSPLRHPPPPPSEMGTVVFREIMAKWTVASLPYIKHLNMEVGIQSRDVYWKTAMGVAVRAPNQGVGGGHLLFSARNTVGKLHIKDCENGYTTSLPPQCHSTREYIRTGWWMAVVNAAGRRTSAVQWCQVGLSSVQIYQSSWKPWGLWNTLTKKTTDIGKCW